MTAIRSLGRVLDRNSHNSSARAGRNPWPGLRRLGAAMRLGLLAACVAWPIPFAAAQSSDPYLAGRFLVASPDMADPNFAETVIYMVEHNAEGGLGLVVNRPVGRMSYADMFAGIGLEPAEGEGEFELHSGGPVDLRRLFVLHTADVVPRGSQRLPGDLALSTGPEILYKIAAGRGPRRHIVVFGYAGWGPGQLEAEIDHGGWENVDFDEKLLFDVADDQKWTLALQQQEIAL